MAPSLRSRVWGGWEKSWTTADPAPRRRGEPDCGEGIEGMECKDGTGRVSGVTLRFWDPRLEEEFQMSHAQMLLRMDLLTLVLELFSTSALLTRCNDFRLMDLIDYVARLFYRGLMVWLIQSRPLWYLRKRGQLISAVRMHVIYRAISLYYKLPLPGDGVLSLTIYMLTRSSISSSTLVVLAMPLYFRDHMIAQLLLIALTLPLGSKTFCETWCPEAETHTIWGQSIGEKIDYFISRFSFLGIPNISIMRWEFMSTDAAVHSCWVVFSFLYFAFGMVLSSAVLYCVESRARFRFLTSPPHESSGRYGCPEFGQVTVYLVIWFSAVVLTMGWAVLKSIEEFAQRGNPKI